MAIRQMHICLALSFVAALVASPLRAQYAPEPDTYTIVQLSALAGPPGQTMTIYRRGSKAIIDITHPGQSAADNPPVRSLYDLQAHTNSSWDPTATAATCGGGTFSGDWGDPFAGSTDMVSQLTQANAKQVGTETLNGFSTKVYEVSVSGQDMKAWVDTKYGLLIKLTGGGATMQEIKSLTLTAPDASTFALPTVCTAAAAAVVDDASAKIAAETGGNGKDYVSANNPQSSSTSCTVVFKVVMMGTMQPITSGYKLGLSLDQNPGSPTKPVTSSQLHDGALVIPNAPPLINLSLDFGDGGGADAFLHRQCFGPRTLLYFVVKNPSKITDASDWLWSKTGK